MLTNADPRRNKQEHARLVLHENYMCGTPRLFNQTKTLETFGMRRISEIERQRETETEGTLVGIWQFGGERS